MIKWEKESFVITKLEKGKEFRNSKSNSKWKRRRNNLMRKMRMKRMKKAMRNLRKRMTLMMKMKRNQISTSSKTITKTLKGSEKYVNMTKRLKKTKEENQTWKNRETKSQPKSKTLIMSWWKLKKSWKFIRRRNFSKLTNSSSHYPSKHPKSSIWSTSTTNTDCKKTFLMPYCLRRQHLED